MKILELLTKSSSSNVKSRGIDYALQNRVRIEEDDPQYVTAVVQGSDDYDVTLDLEGRNVLATCSCPYVADNFAICKHIWATVMKSLQGPFAKAVERLNPTQFIIDPDLEDEDDEDEDEDRYSWKPKPLRAKQTPAPKPKAPPPPPVPAWVLGLAELRAKLQTPKSSFAPIERRPLFVIDPIESLREEALVIRALPQLKLKNGGWGTPKKSGFKKENLRDVRDPRDLQLLALLGGAETKSPYGHGYGHDDYYSSSKIEGYRLNGPLLATLLPLFAQTDQLAVQIRPNHSDCAVLTFDPGPPWELAIPVASDAKSKDWSISAAMTRNGETKPFSSFLLAVPGIAIWEGKYAAFEDRGSFAWVSILKKRGGLTVPKKQAEEFVEQLLKLPHLPKLDLPEEMLLEEVAVVPQARLLVKPATEADDAKFLEGELSFDYGGEIVSGEEAPGRGVLNRKDKKFFLRDVVFEIEAGLEMIRRGFTDEWTSRGKVPYLKATLLSKIVPDLIAAGWHVEAEGKLFRQAGEFKLEVNSGVDWFDLNATADFDGQSVALPLLLEALRKGENTVVLDDGNLGMLPEEWLEKYGLLARLGTVEGDSVRFRKSQVGLLDALLATRPDISFDKQFAKARDQLRKFEGVNPVDPPKGFTGELREYQREGLGWLLFLRKFGFGGCLADDMGLGKTVQVLAMLAGKRKGPALVVVPKSLVFNWKSEAAKFAPKLKVLDHTGSTRDRSGAQFQDFDIVLTTYGILRMDATVFAEVQFDTCVLDESQAAKNANTETSKAVRLIRADHRVAMSGTPVENHLGELWTLFEFLNPGMLGQASLFAGAGQARNPPPETRELLAKAFRPYILRRTKGQVAKDLPAKTEQTVYCDLEPEQRKLYDELRDHYRAKLLKKIDTDGMNKSKFIVLEALLRLRQAACHPGLIDNKRAGEDCAKLDVLLPQLKEIVEEGHKTLVFSQFTSLLAIVKKKLDAEGIVYEYLDGKTTDRQARVDRFQTDPECKVFLISLKAGGVGLNLTAAEYVYLLDPWWNPAAEAQAIDRSHRIGQTKPVFAYRLIARNTVEEKVLALQETKRALADAILGGEGGLVTDLKREDLEMLLS